MRMLDEITLLLFPLFSGTTVRLLV
jgi:hypothetical protein